MPVCWGMRVGIVVVSLLSLGGLLQAAESPDLGASGPLYLRMSAPGAVARAPAAKGTLVVPEEPLLPRHLAIGFNDLGGQLRLHLRPSWAVEGRFLMGSANSDFGQVHANVFGMRGYRFFEERRRFQLYAGVEGDYVHTSLRSVDTTGNSNSIATISGFGETSGYALGAFGGVEYRFWKRLAIDFDIGPYMIGLQEKVTHVSDATLDFVANTALNVYLF